MKRILWNEPERLTIDEIVVEGCTVHLEQMDTGHYWLGVTLPDGRSVSLNLWSKTAIRCTLQESDVAWERDEAHPG